MARTKKTAPIDLSIAYELSHGLIARLSCPPGAKKAFLRDKEVPGLRVRVTSTGAKAFVYEAKLNGKHISQTLGRIPLMSIPEAQAKARDLARTVKTEKADPRDIKRQREATEASLIQAKHEADIAQVEVDKVEATTVGDAWTVYLADRKPRWSERHYADHLEKAASGGTPAKRTGTIKVPGPLHPLMAIPLKALDAAAIEAWAKKEAATRPASARLSLRLLKAFLGWCSEQSAYAPLMPASNAAKTKRSRESLGKPGIKQDALERGQLPAWFDAVGKLQNYVVASYLQTLLLTGARPGEVLTMRWEDVNTQWKGITIRDKVEGERTIPLTPYVEHLLSALPRRNEWVFSSPGAAGGVLTIPRNHHVRACAVAGLSGLTLHGLRRSFKSLTEWLEVPAGVVAQLMGHKPSATAEKHYTVRPLDLLRLHHERIEEWILEKACVTFNATQLPGTLRIVAAG